ncbi:sigma factor [Amnibacterium flavum]|uniref:sigma factor n=1 Tax=Amnibacterium flavum TaxID=2173173 RepID=UPI001403602F|nr:sigma factor [Amnibacterium flavum]
MAPVPGRVLPHQPLDQLVVLIADGNRAALSQFYDRTAPRVLALVRGSLADDRHCESIAEAVFLEVWRNAGRYDPRAGEPLAWVLTLAREEVTARLSDSERNNGSPTR